jgi:hypothetical protein
MMRVLSGELAMSKPTKSAVLLGVATLLGMAVAAVGVVSTPAVAADMAVKAAPADTGQQCGYCGCLHVSFDRHRGVESTYGLDFDPRNFDQTEPYFYLGKVRTYPQYWVDGQCPPGQAN